MATLQDMEMALVNAHRAGDSDAARKLASAIVEARKDAVNQIPGTSVPGATATAPEPTLTEKAIGTGEAALTTVTGATTGALGLAAGTIAGITREAIDGKIGAPGSVQRVAETAGNAAEALTYTPRTQSGQEQAEAVGKVAQQLIPVAPLAAQMAPAAATVRPAAQATSTARAALQQAVRAKVEEAMARRQAAQQPTPTPGTMGSVGAAGTDIATVRRMSAQELPAPIELTKGQATRTFEQQRFEREMAKDPVKGQPLRERFAQQNDALLKNFDLWVDETGATKADLPSVGDAVTAALRERAMADKARIRSAYKAAEKSGDMEAPVTLADAVNYLNENAPDAVVAPILDAVKARAIRLGIARPASSTGPTWTEFVGQRMGEYMKSEGGHAGAIRRIGEEWNQFKAQQGGDMLEPVPVPLKTAELFRRAISNATDAEPTNIRHSAQIKGLIDAATDGAGGTLYKEARKLRSRYAQNYENIGLVRDLMNTKRGLSDQRVAAEDVFRRAILSSSTGEVKQMRRILQTGGESGQQAWKELQGAAVRHIRDQATKNVARNERGQEIISASGLDKAVQQLDQSGKLDFIFGRRGAEQLRAVNDLAKVVYTAPPGAVNTSNTASVILAALDMATSGLVGMPVPIMSGLRILTTHVKDRQIQRRIQEALGIKPEPKKVKGPVSVVPKTPAQRVPESRTVH